MNGDVSPDGNLNSIREGFRITFVLRNPEDGNEAPPRNWNHMRIICIKSTLACCGKVMSWLWLVKDAVLPLVTGEWYSLMNSVFISYK